MKSVPTVRIYETKKKRGPVAEFRWGPGALTRPLPAPGKPICHRFQNSAIIRIAMSPSPREVLSSGVSMAALEYYKRLGSAPMGGPSTCVPAGKPASSTGGLKDQCQPHSVAVLPPPRLLWASHGAPAWVNALGRTREWEKGNTCFM